MGISLRFQTALAIAGLTIFLNPTTCFGQYAYRAMFPKPESISSFPIPRVHPPVKPELVKVPYPQPVHRDASLYPAWNVPPWAVHPDHYNLDRYPPVGVSPELVRDPYFPVVHWLTHRPSRATPAELRVPRQP